MASESRPAQKADKWRQTDMYDNLESQERAPQKSPFPVQLQGPQIPGAMPTEPADGSGLNELWSILHRHRYILLSFVAVALLCAVALVLFWPKLYESSALVKVDHHQIAVVTGPETSSSGPSDEMDQIVTTEMELAQADNVLRPVVEKYHLLDLEKQTAGLKGEKLQQVLAAPIKLSRLTVKRPPNTFLLQITYRAHNPKLAAEIANAIAASLVLHSNDAAAESLQQTTGILESNMQALQKKLDQESQDLADFEKQLGVINPEQRETVLNAQVVQLNQELTTVQGTKADLEASVHLLHNDNANLATLQTLDSLRTVNDNSLNESLTRLEAARQQLATVQATYGESHPEYHKAKLQVDELSRQLNSRMQNSRDRIQTAYRQIGKRESNLKALLNKAKQELDSVQAKTQQYETLKLQADSDRHLMQDLNSKTLVAGINRQFDSATLQVVAPARVPADQVFPKASIVMPVAFVISLILGILLVILAHMVDSSFTSPDEIVQQLHLDVLAILPATKSPPQFNDEEEAVGNDSASKRRAKILGRYFEGVRTLRTLLTLESANTDIRTIAVTSATPAEGKSTITSQLAKSLAMVGKKVLLVDGDMRRPVMHKRTNVAQSPGLSELLEGSMSIESAIVKSNHNGVYILPAGPSTQYAPDLITMAFSRFLSHIPTDFDYVLIDCPPVQGAAESVEITSMVDGVVLVVKQNGAAGKLLSDSVTRIQRSRGRILGIVMNQVESADSSYYNYYYYSADGEKSQSTTTGV